VCRDGKNFTPSRLVLKTMIEFIEQRLIL